MKDHLPLHLPLRPLKQQTGAPTPPAGAACCPDLGALRAYLGSARDGTYALDEDMSTQLQAEFVEGRRRDPAAFGPEEFHLQLTVRAGQPLLCGGVGYMHSTRMVCLLCSTVLNV